MKYVYKDKVKEFKSVLELAPYILSDKDYIQYSFTIKELLDMEFDIPLPAILETIFASDELTTIINKEFIKLDLIYYLFLQGKKTDEERLEDLQRRGIYCDIDEMHYVQKNYTAMAEF